jgi:hypothetical protein
LSQSRLVLRDTVVESAQLRVTLEPGPNVTTAAGPMLFAHVDAPGSIVLYASTGSPPGPAGARAITATMASASTQLALDSSPIGAALKAAPPGTVVALKPDFSEVLGYLAPQWIWQDVSLAVIRDSTRRRAVLIPLAGKDQQALTPDIYRLYFKMDRARWSTTGPPDTANHYQPDPTGHFHAEATLSLSL